MHKILSIRVSWTIQYMGEFNYRILPKKITFRSVFKELLRFKIPETFLDDYINYLIRNMNPARRKQLLFRIQM